MTLIEITGLITPICGVAIAYFTYINNREIRKNTQLTREVEEKVVHIDDNQKALETAQSVLHTQINGKMDKMVELAEKAKFAEGKEAGKEHAKLEQAPIHLQNLAEAQEKGRLIGKEEQRIASIIVPVPAGIPQLTPEDHAIKVEIVKIPKIPKTEE